MNKKSIYIIIAIVIFFIGGMFSYTYYQKIFGKKSIKNGAIYIDSNDNLKDIEKLLIPFVKHPEDFLWVAKKKKFIKPKEGKYVLKKGMSMNDIINLLRSGNQTPVKVSFNNQDTLEKLAGRIAQQLKIDSLSLLKVMKDSLFLNKHNFTEKSALGMYIPNSYEFYWNTSAKNFRNRLFKEYQYFWTKKRLEKARKIGLTKNKVLILASIVQKETSKKDERPIVARLYLNRLKKSWPLQADPTIIFTLKEKNGQNFTVKRVLTKDLEINSPYNTYKNKGLPPTLISMPDISSIDAVLNPSKQSYLYMCASVDNIGFHEFSNSLAKHRINAIKYQQWINKKKINR